MLRKYLWLICLLLLPAAAHAAVGTCGPSQGSTGSVAPTSLCNSGTASALIGSGPWSWICQGGPGETTQMCTAYTTGHLFDNWTGPNGFFSNTTPLTVDPVNDPDPSLIVAHFKLASYPISVHGPAAVLQFGGGASHTVVLKSDHTVVAWGGSQGQSTLPSGLRAKAITAGTYHTLAVADDGHVVAAGAYVHPVNNDDPLKAPVPVVVPDALTRAGAGVVAVSGGYSHSLALMDDGTLVAWGDNTYGQSTIPFDPPNSTVPLSGVVAIASGHHHNLALKSDGSVVAWGRNYETQAVVPNFGAKVVAISAKAYNSMALTENGKVFVWGANEIGQLDVPLTALSGVKAIAAGGHHMVALKNDGTLVTWGSDLYGQQQIPAGLNGISSIAAGTYFTLALKGELAMVGWGNNQSHQCDVPGTVYLPLSHGKITCTPTAPLYGTDAACVIAPDLGYGLADFLVNAIPKTVTSDTYTLSKIGGYQSITATFSQGAAVTSFDVPALVKSLTIPINSFTATGQGPITGYQITQSSTIPSLTTGWLPSAPLTYTVATSGLKTLYAWAKDAAGNISPYKSASVNVDMTGPSVTFSIGKSASNTFNVPVSLTAIDDGKITGYVLKESNLAPVAGDWVASAPTGYTFSSVGPKTLFAWAKDEAGNVSVMKSATVNIDMTLPVITAFTVKSPGSGLSLQITGFTATDNLAVGGYLITESGTTPPLTADWSVTKPLTYTVKNVDAQGNATLYGWVKDTAGNISLSKSVAAIVDSKIPTVDVFDVPAVVKSLTIPITKFTATDDKTVAGYLITLTDTKPDAALLTWKTSAPTSFAVATAGVKTLYAWAKDWVGNVSDAKTAVVNFDMIAPVVTLTAPAGYNSLTVPISVSATDAGKITGYIVKDSSTAPLLTAAEWVPAPPTSFTFSAGGSKLVYAWARDEAGNISVAKSATIVIDMVAPVASTFTVKSPSNSLDVPITAFAGTDNVGIGGYKVTETNDKPLPDAAGWSATRPLTFHASREGAVDLYGWVKDKAGNVCATSKAGSTTIDATLPTVTSFKAPATVKTLTFAIDAFDAQDDKTLAGYMITTTNVKPAATLTTWKATRPTSFTVTTAGVKTLYAWAKDWVGNVSAVTALSTAIVNVDMTAPVVTFTVPSPQKSSTVNFTLSAADAGIVTGYIVKEGSAAPLANSPDWVATAPTSYTFASTGTKTLYAWAKDEMDHVSVGKSAIVVIDTVAPTLTGFAVKSPYNSLKVPVTIMTGTDNVGVAGYLVTETADTPSLTAPWSTLKPATYTVNTVDAEGHATLYGWVKDKAGNISASKNATVTIDNTPPVVDSFEPKLMVNSLTVPVANFMASDNKTVAGYLITITSTAPAATLTTWKATAPATFLVSSAGAKILYAWAKDWVGNVSASKAVTITVDMTKPAISTFTVTSPASGLTVPITAFVTAVDATGIAGYMITETSAAPTASAAGWLAAKPDSYTASGAGSKTLYAWVKDGAGNVSLAKTALVTLKLP